jgi:hypothetical protein
MFKSSKDATAANKTAHKAKAVRYPKGIRVIFNSKAYVNKKNLKQWAR